ncbi:MULTISPECIES: substrate-binding periplasmic protein [Pseudomonas aeruginosa group]|uniref:substrate-binding periplasmic protein n=1 Tax=Pseudomonas aeruginosa group TaxID=136841 RepID=UPI00053DF401|nr:MULTISPECIES: transporter substrate-binding domain-containing protein [Pseudomonas aeruginosa group]KAB0748461.1 amino acid ABC transporter substrate-binding protein [Pseudomonas aeruginosa]KSD80245.2 amino acid ABC transporter substrate-binding protein [Pseudomonas aeruginosa]KSP94430.2 amino acid ABC transporter substrate-binding protein [Pseudomonas aeruginosa]MBG4069505.1 transporter substrate-binding domain-containing protein [Pseudomonas aeruginosa]MBG5602410.1 transporter substrate-b
MLAQFAPSALADLANCVLRIRPTLHEPSPVAMTRPFPSVFAARFVAPALLLLQFAAAQPATAGDSAAPPLRFAVMESWGMPLIRLEESQPTAGIVHDITRSLARQVGREALYHPYPRARIEQAMDGGEIDVRCYISPAWLSRDFPGYRWSVPLLVQRDILAAREGFAPIPEALPAQRIGTVLGYSYPRLQALFDIGRLRRDDARTQDLVLEKLRAGRYRYAVSHQLALRWNNRQTPGQAPLQEAAQLEENPVSCLVRDAAEVPVEAILKTFEEMKRNGEIEEILRRYR